MPRGSYLRRTAERAVQRGSPIVPPRRVARARDETTVDEVPPRSIAPRIETPPPVALPVEATAADPVATTREAPAGSAPATPVVHPSPARRPPDFVFDAPRRAAPPAPRARMEMPTSLPPLAQPVNAGHGIASAGSHEQRDHSVGPLPAPTPFMAALATAVRWTSSDPAQGEPGRSVPRTEAPRTPMRGRNTESSLVPAVPAARPPSPPVPTPATTTPDRPRSVTVPSPSARTSSSAARESLPDPERHVGVHIGSMHVEILPPPLPVVTPLPAPSRGARAAASQPLSRGHGSSIGLRQS